MPDSEWIDWRASAAPKGGVWRARAEAIRQLGLTRKQAQEVYRLMDVVGAFGSQTLASIATEKLAEVYDEAEAEADGA